jgi:hypothetical protein
MPVFISHSQQDHGPYSFLCLALDGANVARWDPSQMALGQPLAQQLRVIVYKSDASLNEGSIPKQLQGDVWTNDASQLIRDVRHEIQRVQAATPLSGGMVYILRELAGRGWSLRDLTPMWAQFNEKQGEPDPAYKATKYACQCLEALGLAESFGGDEYGITSHGMRFLESGSPEHRFA